MEAELRIRYGKVGQSHVFAHINEVSAAEKVSLLEQLQLINVESLPTLLDGARAVERSVQEEIRPYAGPVGRSFDTSLAETSRKLGLDAISRGEIAALVLAGGQGTRLGFSGPKGMYDIGLPSRKTLFQLIADRLRKLEQLASSESDHATIPFYIMTSPINHEETVSYFKSNSFLGLKQENVYFFQQGMLPCVTEDGKLIMESPAKVAMAPDGNGGIYPSLLSTGALDDLDARGVLYLHVFSIDNALIRPADPVFMGYCISEKSDIGNKVVWKTHAHEKVGVIATRSGKPCIVEYSEITKEMAESTEESGRLKFGAGNICNHFYTVEFIRNTILPNMGNLYHIARKKIPFYDKRQKMTVTPAENNGIKLETFIFDVLPLAQRMAIFEVERSEEFSPVKNLAGSPSDSPDTARAMISDLAKKWVIDAGGRVEGVEGICEISPMTSYAGEGLKELVGGKVFHRSFLL